MAVVVCCCCCCCCCWPGRHGGGCSGRGGIQAGEESVDVRLVLARAERNGVVVAAVGRRGWVVGVSYPKGGRWTESNWWHASDGWVGGWAAHSLFPAGRLVLALGELGEIAMYLAVVVPSHDIDLSPPSPDLPMSCKERIGNDWRLGAKAKGTDERRSRAMPALAVSMALKDSGDTPVLSSIPP